MQHPTIICAAFVVLLALTSFTANAFPQGVNIADDLRQTVNSLFDELPEATHQAAEENLRQKRATCDLASGLGKNDSFCAAHCLLRGNRGGYCNNQRVCVCRN